MEGRRLDGASVSVLGHVVKPCFGRPEQSGQLRTLLRHPELPCHGGIARQWQAEDILQHLRDKLPSAQSDFLTALVTAMNDDTQLPGIDRFALWRDQPPVPLEAPWPPA